MANEKWYVFKRNEDQEYVKMKKTFSSRKEAVDYAANHNYLNSMISNNPELYMSKEFYHR